MQKQKAEKAHIQAISALLPFPDTIDVGMRSANCVMLDVRYGDDAAIAPLIEKCQKRKLAVLWSAKPKSLRSFPLVG